MKVQVRGNLTSIGGSPLLDASVRGVGLAMLPAWMLRSALQSGALISVLEDWKPDLYKGGSGGEYAVYLDDPSTKPVIRSFIGHLLAAL